MKKIKVFNTETGEREAEAERIINQQLKDQKRMRNQEILDVTLEVTNVVLALAIKAVIVYTGIKVVKKILED